MSLKTQIGIVIGVVIVIGLGWFLASQISIAPAAPTPSSEENNAVTTNQPNTTSVSAEPGPSSTNAPVDFISATNAAFDSLSAQRVDFVRVSLASDPKFGAVYALFKDDIAFSKKTYPTKTDFSMGMAAFDLNADGTDEIIVREDLPGFCGSGGCTVAIFRKEGKTWSNILDVLAQDPIGIENKLASGYRKLLLPLHGVNASYLQLTWFVWDGTQYKLGPVGALWNGSSFTFAQ